MSVVFVNYRVRDQPGYATLLHRELAARFGGGRVFLASRSVRPGDDFVEGVFDTLRRSGVLLAVIGPDWLRLLPGGDTDWVHREIGEAFARRIRVIPVLVEDTELPAEHELPADIATLARCQYVRLRHYSIESDMALLLDELERTVPELGTQPPDITTRRLFRVAQSECVLGVIPGSIRWVRDVDIWVNSENTDMSMARPTEFSISAIIRYWGAARDESGRITQDVIADELRAKVGDQRPVAPGTALVTGVGELAATHNVSHIVHVAAVHGEPGAGFRQVRDIEWCVVNVLGHAERLAVERGARSILFPMLGTGTAGADPARTARMMVTGVLGHLTRHPNTLLNAIFLLGYDEREQAALQSVLRTLPGVSPAGDAN